MDEEHRVASKTTIDICDVQQWQPVPGGEGYDALRSPGVRSSQYLHGRLKPETLYAYLKARFGPPNGPAMLLRIDAVDNLIHWEWVLRAREWVLAIEQFNDRIELNAKGPRVLSEWEWNSLFESIRQDLAPHGKALAEIRKGFEHWDLFVNPVARIRKVVDQAMSELASLESTAPEIPGPQHTHREVQRYYKQFKRHFETVDKIYFLCSTLKFHLPVMAEAFINLVIAILGNADIRADQRVFQSVLREEVDLRVKKLHMYCKGFKSAVDVKDRRYGAFHTLMNSRNQTLHANLDIDSLNVGSVDFDARTIPLFQDDVGLAVRLWDAQLHKMTPADVQAEHKAVVEFIDLICEHMEPSIAEVMRLLLEHVVLGYNAKEERYGVVFPLDIATSYGHN
jgi:hypothetical protein